MIKKLIKNVGISILFILSCFFISPIYLYAASYSSIDKATDVLARNIAGDKSLSKKKIAVVGFRNNSNSFSNDNFSAIFEDELTTSLTEHIYGYVIAKNQIDTILGELKITRDDIFDSTTQKRFGKLASADVIISGTYRVEKKHIIVNVQVVDIERGVALKSERVYIDKSAMPKGAFKNVIDNSSEKYKSSSNFWSENKLNFFKPATNKYGLGIGWASSPNYGVEGYNPVNSINLIGVMKMIELSLQFGLRDELKNEDSTFAFDIAYFLPFIRSNNETYQSFLFAGYRLETLSNDTSRPGWGGPVEQITHNALIYGGAFRYILWFEGHGGFELAFERTLSLDENQKDGNIFKVGFIVMW